MTKHCFSALLLSALLLSAGSMATAAENVIRPVRGIVDAVNGNTLIITTRQGEKLDVALTDQTKVNSVSEAK